MNPSQKVPVFLNESELETQLRQHPLLCDFWATPSPLIIFRCRPNPQDPVYEIQLAYDLGDRLETHRWLWVNALNGEILRQFPEG